MGKAYRPWTPTQGLMFPPSPSDWLPDDHLVYFLLDLVDELDLSAIHRKHQAKDPRGSRPYHPGMMTLLLLYGYCVGVPSSRRIEKATYEDVAFRVLSGGQHPDHTRISEFRRVHLKELAELFVQVLRLCQKAGLVKLGHVALDGTKEKANASKHKAMSYERMEKTEARLKKEIAELLRKAESVDEEEDDRYGRGRRGDELPDELRRREERLKKIKQAKAELEAEAAAAHARKRAKQAQDAQEKAESEEGEEREEAARKHAEESAERSRKAADQARAAAKKAAMDEPNLELRREDEFPSHQVQSTPDGKPKPKAQRNFTDPDSRIMKYGSGYMQGYNAQAVVDAECQVIVAADVTNQPPDTEHFIPMLRLTISNCGAVPDKALADAGYWSEANEKAALEMGIDPYIATGRLRRGELESPPVGRIPKGLGAKERMRRKLRTRKGKALYARRKAIVEPVFGQVKEPRGLRQFLLRGLDKVRGEFSLITLTHNILKLWRASAAPA